MGDSFKQEHEDRLRKRLDTLRDDLDREKERTEKYSAETQQAWENWHLSVKAKDGREDEWHDAATKIMHTHIRSMRNGWKLQGKIIEVRADLTEHVLRREGTETLAKIQAYSQDTRDFNKDTRDAIRQGRVQNWIMVGLAAFMAVMAFLTFLNTRQLPRQASPPSLQQEKANSMYQE